LVSGAEAERVIDLRAGIAEIGEHGSGILARAARGGTYPARGSAESDRDADAAVVAAFDDHSPVADLSGVERFVDTVDR
jgi:hypothetical protein